MNEKENRNKRGKQGRILLIVLITISFIFLISLAQAQTTTTMQPVSQQLSFSSLNLQQPFLQQQTTFQQDPNYFYPYYAQDPSLQYGFTPEMCNKTGMDFIVQIMPDACQPAPVRSDLLEEQAVPVFCKLTGIKINPLIQVPYIERIDAKTELRSPEIMSVTYHPPGSALSFMSYVPPSEENQLEGVPMMSNLGYLVIYLKQQPVEANMPNSVKLEETLKLTYRVARTFGISQNSFTLREMTNEEWQANYKQYSFWQGKGYLRLDNIQGNKAKVSVYRDSQNVVGSVTLAEGQMSQQEIKLPGFYCGAGVKLKVDEIDIPKTRARLLVNGDEVLLRENQEILNSGCKVVNIQSTGSLTGGIEILCDGGTRDYLELRNLEAELTVEGKKDTYTVGKEMVIESRHRYVGYIGREYTQENKNVGTYLIVFEKEDGTKMRPADKDRVLNALGNLVLKEHRAGNQVQDYDGVLIKQKLQNDYKIDYLGNVFVIKSSAQSSQLPIVINRIGGILETTYHGGIEGLFQEAIEAYENVDYSYPLVPNQEGTIYGVQSLMAAAELAKHFGKYETQAYYLAKLIEKYDGEENVAGVVDDARRELSTVLASDFSQATRTINNKGQSYRVTLLSIEKPSLASQSVVADVNGEIKHHSLGDLIGGWRIDSIDENTVSLTCTLENCGTETNKIIYGTPRQLSVGGTIYGQDLRIEIKQISSVKEVQVTVLPFEERRTTEANFTVEIGIEKRAIQLNPEKTGEKIQSLNRMISSLENVKNTLGKVVETWKKACLVGGAVLWAKNFIEGLDGTALARRTVMDQWSEWCSVKANQNSVGAQTVAGCYKAKEVNITRDIDRTKEAIHLSNQFIKEVKSKDGVVKKSGLFGLGSSIDKDQFFIEAQKLIQEKDEYKELFNQNIEVNQANIQGTISSTDLSEFKLQVLKDRGFIGTEDVKDIIFNLKMQEFVNKKDPNKYLSNVLNNKTSIANFQLFDNYNRIIKYDNNNAGALDIMRGIDVNYIPSVNLEKKIEMRAPVVDGSKLSMPGEANVAVISVNNVLVLVALQDLGDGSYQIKSATPVKVSGASYQAITSDAELGQMILQDEKGSISLSEFKSKIMNSISISGAAKNCDRNPMDKSAREIKFWESGTYKGQVAYMPIDENRGFYVATRSYTGLEGELVAYEMRSSNINTYFLANVGPDGKPDFDYSGSLGGDDCGTVVSLIQGTELEGWRLGLTDSDAQALNRQAISCMADATRQYASGSRNIETQCGDFKLGKPPAVRPTAQCEDFMSPGDCRIMYNLCDPVMCPSSRCDWGGRYPVDNVFSTGIVGSLVLCLPNFENGKGVYVPICLTGLHAGIDNLEVTLKLYRDCLQENLNSGKMTGICDQIYSLYLCEFLWQTLDPLIKIGIPSLTESLTNRGGGEYALFGESWNNAMDSINYFTQYYGVNTFQAFKERSTAQVGTEICKRFVSVAYPTQAKFWEEISKPESPTQFFATLQEMEGIGPSQSHYKIYYQIYAGQDQGVAYRIYLASPGTPGYYMTPDRYFVPGGFGYLAAGQYLGESPDFTAPSGYREICVEINGQNHCGFGQVTTNFAIDELQNLYLKNQVKQDIKTTDDCISGTSSLIPSLSLNLQSMVQSMEEPAIYRKGIIRICSSQNPGAGTEADRYKLIGYCDNPEIGCYLDMNSVDNSISDLGIREELATYAEEQQINALLAMNKGQGLTHPDETRAELTKKEKQINDQNGIRERVEAMEDEIFRQVQAGETVSVSGKQELVNEIQALINQLGIISKQALYDSEKARADYTIAELKEFKARIEAAQKIAETEKARKKATTCESFEGTWKDTCAANEKEVKDTSDQDQHYGKVCCRPSEAPVTPGVTPTGEIVPFTVWPVSEFEGYIQVRSCYSYDEKSISFITQQNGNVQAVAQGTVIKVGTTQGSAAEASMGGPTSWNYVIIEHTNGLYTYYGYLEVEVVYEGQDLDPGEPIGQVAQITRPKGLGSETIGMLYFRVFNSKDFSADKGVDPLCFFKIELLSRVNVPNNCNLKEGQEKTFYEGTYCKAARGKVGIPFMEVNPPEKLQDAIIVIDAGHGGSDPGAVGVCNINEKDVNLAISKELKILLSTKAKKVVMTRETDTGATQGRATFANRENANLFIAIHANANGADVRGAEVWSNCKGCAESFNYRPGTEFLQCNANKCEDNSLNYKLSKKFSALILNELDSKGLQIRGDGLKDWDDKKSTYIKDATMPSVLIEAGFLSNQQDCEILKSTDGQKKIAEAIYQAIMEYYSAPPTPSAKCEDIGDDDDLCLVTKINNKPCWYDHKYERCKTCPEECTGQEKGMFNLNVPSWLSWTGPEGWDLTFKTLKDCEENNCLLELCWWTGSECKTTTPFSKIAQLMNMFQRKIESEALEVVGGSAHGAPINNYLKNPNLAETIDKSNLAAAALKLRELKQELEEIRSTALVWLGEGENPVTTQQVTDINKLLAEFDVLLEKISVASSQVFIVSNEGSTYSQGNKILDSGAASQVCVIFEQDGVYYNNDIDGQTINGNAVLELASATIKWYKIEAWPDHEAAGFALEQCPSVNYAGDIGIGREVNGQFQASYYCYYQNVGGLDSGENFIDGQAEKKFYSQGKDTIQYKQTLVGSDWCISVSNEPGTYRFRAEVNGISSPGKPLSLTGTSASAAGYNPIFNGKEPTLIEKNYYNFANGGISDDVHRIARKSNYYNDNIGKTIYSDEDQLHYMEYIEAFKGIVWIWGATKWQADNAIGMDCADITFAPFNLMISDGLSVPPVGERTAPSLEGHQEVPVYTGIYHVIENDPYGNKIWRSVGGNDFDMDPMMILPNRINLADLFLIKTDYNKQASHTLIFYEDNLNPGTLDKQDTFIFVGKQGLMKANYLNQKSVYFVIRRLNELA